VKRAEIHCPRSSGLVIGDPGEEEVELRCFDHPGEVEVGTRKNRNLFEGLAIEFITAPDPSGSGIKVEICVAKGP
jgi:hypothetical protein